MVCYNNFGEDKLNKTAKEILEKLEANGFVAYIVGGYVRDFLLKKTTNDIDICTNVKTKDMMTLFSGKANAYGSFAIQLNELNIEITTFREEHNYQMRKPTTIFYTMDLKTDLLRRDFTINTICMDKSGNIIDELNGIEDLNHKIIRVVGDTKKKIIEDPLRILRAIRFATTLDFSIEKELQEAIMQNKELLKTLSAYRIKEELSKILLSPNYKKGLQLLKQFDLCSQLGISFQNVVYIRDLCGMFAQMKLNQNLPFTKKEKENIVKIRKILDLKMLNQEIIYEYGLYLSLIAGEILGIASDSIHEMYKALPIYSRKDLHISYQEICECLHLSPSKKAKEIEMHLIAEVINGRIINHKNELKKFLISNKARWLK